jgi:hypothetical protein
MLEPISALVASSCSKNGSSEVSTETICFGLISICVIFHTYSIVGSVFTLALIRVIVKLPNSSIGAQASAIISTFV